MSEAQPQDFKQFASDPMALIDDCKLLEKLLASSWAPDHLLRERVLNKLSDALDLKGEDIPELYKAQLAVAVGKVLAQMHKNDQERMFKLLELKQKSKAPASTLSKEDQEKKIKEILGL